eukprot:4819322-Prymnesium_polylepis.1
MESPSGGMPLKGALKVPLGKAKTAGKLLGKMPQMGSGALAAVIAPVLPPRVLPQQAYGQQACVNVADVRALPVDEWDPTEVRALPRGTPPRGTLPVGLYPCDLPVGLYPCGLAHSPTPGDIRPRLLVRAHPVQLSRAHLLSRRRTP